MQGARQVPKVWYLAGKARREAHFPGIPMDLIRLLISKYWPVTRRFEGEEGASHRFIYVVESLGPGIWESEDVNCVEATLLT